MNLPMRRSLIAPESSGVCAIIPLTRLFAIEYAALFEVHNAGLAAWGLPFPVSGSSNHFRVSALRDIHGWDTWNVTEDADIGLRLARFGYDVDALDSATLEEAPISFKAWLGQRRRWFKGWFQTLIGLTREPSVLVAEIGILQSGVLALLFVALLFGPLLWIPANAFVIYSFLCNGLAMPEGVLGVSLTVLWMLVGSLGAVSLLWFALFGMKRQCLFALWPVLPFLPIYYCLHTVAAWMALVDLARQPFHWQKTEHGVKRKTKRPPHLPVLSHLPR